MSRYMILFRANPSVFPTDPKQMLATAEATFEGADHLLETGVLEEVGWFTSAEGYAIQEADSKDKVIELISAFFPYFSQEVHEIVPHDKAKEAILASARRAAQQ